MTFWKPKTKSLKNHVPNEKENKNSDLLCNLKDWSVLIEGFLSDQRKEIVAEKEKKEIC